MADAYSRRNFWFHKFEFVYYRIFKHFFSIKKPTDFFIRIYCGGNTFTNPLFGHSFEFIPTNDIGRKLFFSGDFEQDEILICRALIKEDDIVLDIGANIGYHSVHFANYAAKGHIYSFEPSPDTFRILSKNCKPYSNISPINIGIGETERMATFHFASDHAYSGFKDTGNKVIIGCKDLQIVSLNKWVKQQDLKNIDFIKIDVEGFEIQVINGMSEVIVQHKPTLFVEISPSKSQTEDPVQVFSSIIDHGYNAFILEGGELIKTNKHLDSRHNYFFIHHEHAKG